MKWEYYRLMDEVGDWLDTEADKLGADGWELVHVVCVALQQHENGRATVPTQDEKVLYVFRRPLPSTS